MDVICDGTLWAWQCAKADSSSNGMFLCVLQWYPQWISPVATSLMLTCCLLLAGCLKFFLQPLSMWQSSLSLGSHLHPCSLFWVEGGIQSSSILPLSHVAHIWFTGKTHPSLSCHAVDKRVFYSQGSSLSLCSIVLGQSISSFSCHPYASRLQDNRSTPPRNSLEALFLI